MNLDSIRDMKVGDRDAVHAAIMWCTSVEWLNPGTYVRFVDIDAGTVKRCNLSVAQGVVNPFGAEMAREFAVILCPSMVDGPLYHNFNLVGSKNEQRPRGPEECDDTDDDDYDECSGC